MQRERWAEATGEGVAVRPISASRLSCAVSLERLIHFQTRPMRDALVAKADVAEDRVRVSNAASRRR